MDEREKLEKLLSRFKALLYKHKHREIQFNPNNTWKNGKCDYLLREMVKIYGFGDKPVVLNKEKFEQLPQEVLYHGFKSYKYANNFLKDKNYWTGTGSYINGFYVSMYYDNALSYTMKDITNGEYDENKVLKFKFDSNNYIHISDLWFFQECIITKNLANIPPKLLEKFKTLYSFIESISSEYLREEFIDMITSEALLATFLGSDFIVGDDQNKILLNRGKVVLSEESLKSIEKGLATENLGLLK